MAILNIGLRRLIDTRTLNFVKLEEFNTPSYAILSHRWDSSGEEVTYKEFLELRGNALSKAGYRKIWAACQEARKDGIRYIWVDTCCVDHDNVDEVAQNITSMYSHYRNAEICYTYLADVEGRSQSEQLKGLQKSEWFRRGWMLQELLAPREVLFFDKRWRCIGSKSELLDTIAAATLIPSGVLSGEIPLQNVDPTERISWATGLETTRPQDQVYCLLGLLDISMDINYEEDVTALFDHLKRALLEAYPTHGHTFLRSTKTRVTPTATSPHLMVPTYIRPRRLIDTRSLKLVEFKHSTTVPPYATLSHRWVAKQEVKFVDFIELQDESRAKLGYLKILAACKQARKDNISYIWIDTCCIEQRDHEDVSRNIRSMFGYYQNAELCYVYLVDVDAAALHGWRLQEMFRKSEWFKRGWTLQELLAPREVVFYDKTWGHIGTKHELCHEICSVTNIPPQVLSGERPLRDVHVLDRMSWAIERETTRPQDRAYCLCGLLGISIDPDYNENIETSFRRLGRAFIEAHPMPREAFGSTEHCYYLLFEKHGLSYVNMGSVEALNFWRKLSVLGEHAKAALFLVFMSRILFLVFFVYLAIYFTITIWLFCR